MIFIRNRLFAMLARLLIHQLPERLGRQRLGIGVFFAKPFAEVNELAAPGAKGTEGRGEPVTAPFASWTLDLGRVAHADMGSLTRLSQPENEKHCCQLFGRCVPLAPPSGCQHPVACYLRRGV